MTHASRWLLIAATLLAGCTEGDEFFVAPRTDRPERFSGSAVDDANLAGDGLALSEAGAPIDAVISSTAAIPSDAFGTSSPAPTSVVTMLRSGSRIFASYVDSRGARTPAVELIAPDRDFGVPVDLDAAIIIPLRTSTTTQPNGQPLAAAQANSGAWLVVYAYQTLTTTGSGSLGPRRALAAHGFRQTRIGAPLSQDPLLGRVEFGWQVQGQQLALPFTRAGDSVVGFAALSDGLVGMARFSSTASPHQPGDSRPVDGQPGPNSYRFGQEMQRLGLLISQLVTDDPATPEDDTRLALHYASYDLTSLSFEDATEYAVPTGHFEPDNVGAFTGATAYDPGRILVSNQHALLILDDARRSPGTTTILSQERVATVLTAIDQGDGTSALRVSVDADLSLEGTRRGLHGSNIGERQRLLDELRLIGPDEGLSGQTLALVVTADNNAQAPDFNTDEQILVAAIESRRNSLEGTLVNAPQRLSRHLDTAGQSVADPVLEPRVALARDGRAALLIYRQLEDAPQGRGIALNAAAIKLDPASGFPGSRIAAETRIDGGPADVTRDRGATLDDVAAFRLQDELAPRCGVQPRTDLFAVAYEQSGADADRVFVRPLQVNTQGLTTITALPELELESGNPVITDRPTGRGQPFLEGTADLSQLRLLDIGLEFGGERELLLAVYAKEVDDTVVDDGLGDIDILAQLLRLRVEDQVTDRGFRVRLDDTDEVEGASRAARTELVAALPSRVVSAETTADGPSQVTILLRQPSADTVASPLGLFSRTLIVDRLRAAPGPLAAGALFEPQLDAAPERLDGGLDEARVVRLSGSDALTPFSLMRRGAPAVLRAGNRVLALLLEEGHLLGSESVDGFQFSALEGGLPDPQIVDNESFGTELTDPARVFITPLDDGRGGVMNGSEVLYLKEPDPGVGLRALVRRIINPQLF